MRKMRRANREVTDPAVLGGILRDCDVVRVGVTDDEGMFIVPVNFGYETGPSPEGEKPSLRLYLHGAGAGRKADAFSGCPAVAIEMDCGHSLITGDYSCTYSYAYRSIMGSGTVRPVCDEEEKIHGLDLIMEHTAAPEKNIYNSGALKQVRVYCIEVSSYTGKMR